MFTTKSRKPITEDGRTKKHFIRVNPIKHEEYYDGYVVLESDAVTTDSDLHVDLNQLRIQVEAEIER